MVLTGWSIDGMQRDIAYRTRFLRIAAWSETTASGDAKTYLAMRDSKFLLGKVLDYRAVLTVAAGGIQSQQSAF